MHTLSNLAWHSITFDLSAARQLQIFYGCVVGVSVFLNVDATIVLGLGCHVCLKIIYAINMQHKVFIALFVPFSFTVCGCPECALLSFYFLRACVCVCVGAHLHTNTRILTTTHRGGSLELATITVCIVAYSLCLTGHTTSALLLFSCAASYIILLPSANTYAQSLWGAVSTHAGLHNTFTVCRFAFCLLHLLCCSLFLPVLCAEQVFFCTCTHYPLNAALKGWVV